MNIPDQTGTPIPGQTDTMANPTPPTPTGGTTGTASYAGNTIPVDTLATPQTAPNYPTSVVTPSTAHNALSATLAGHEATIAGNPTGTTEPAAPTNSRQPILDRIMAAMDSLGNKGADTAAANAKAGVDTKAQLVTDLTNQYNTTKQNYQNQITALQKNPEGLFGTGLQDKIDQITRQQNQDLANIAVQQNAATGNYDTAIKIATAAVNAKYEPLQAQVDNLTKYYGLTKDDMTTSEQQSAQAAITQKQDAIKFAQQKDLASYTESIKQGDPLYQAQLKKAQYDAANPGASTAGGKVQAALSSFGATFVPGAKLPDGTPVVYNQGGTNYINPNAWKMAIADAPGQGVTRKAFISEFGSQLATDSKGQPLPAYGLTPAEVKIITATAPVPGSTVPPPGT